MQTLFSPGPSHVVRPSIKAHGGRVLSGCSCQFWGSLSLSWHGWFLSATTCRSINSKQGLSTNHHDHLLAPCTFRWLQRARRRTWEMGSPLAGSPSSSSSLPIACQAQEGGFLLLPFPSSLSFLIPSTTKKKAKEGEKKGGSE